MNHCSLNSLAPLTVALHGRVENSLLFDLLRDLNYLGIQTNHQQGKSPYLNAFSIYEGGFKHP